MAESNKYQNSSLYDTEDDYKSSLKFSQDSSSRLCSFYANGYCKYGQNCKFLHQRNSYSASKISQKTLLPRKIDDNRSNSVKKCTSNTAANQTKYHSNSSDGNISKKRLCRYFRAESLLNDNLHTENSSEHLFPSSSDYTGPLDNVVSSSSKNVSYSRGSCNVNLYKSEISEDLNTLNINSNSSKETPKYQSQVSLGPRSFNLSTLSEESLHELRNTEIAQLKKRFPKVEEDTNSFSFIYEPSDPDWSQDFRNLRLQITFPECYPLEVCSITALKHKDYIPGILLRYANCLEFHQKTEKKLHLNENINDWLCEQHEASIRSERISLLFRPFLKWFDRNLEELFKSALKKVTEEEVAINKTDAVAVQSDIISPSCENDTLQESSFHEEQSPILPSSSTELTSTEKEMNPSSPKQKSFQTVNNSELRGVKIVFTGVELEEGVAALFCKKLSGTVHCIRCKTSCNVVLIPNKNSSIACSKCSKRMECNFNPTILHQYSSLLGSIHLVECQIVDINLVECIFLIDCLNCAKQVSIEGVHYGQKQKFWCKFCNQKLVMGIESTKFQLSTTSSVASKAVEIKKTIKKKDPVIKEGCPLPECGACKHYKKSFRWLRFPCCGRLYPCDMCHDEKEIDHDMKFASRMVCGFCSKEQPYSKEKPCFNCSSNMISRPCAFWEGGKGCRNSVTMSRNDKHKYAGTGKTISKKSQSVGKKKK
ncbi:uncharacterized protein C18H10.09 [Caerostris extrusa]|uniref:Nucleoporin NUP42 n=1 Tax=Caerostris extrusa TaxID=172846 RepID=A0AAV4WNL1_CAEEX|nr:uncharacterized protein C18H10.09 [Caerostris extrusa]